MMNKQEKELLISFKKSGYTHLLCDEFTDGISLFKLVYGEIKEIRSADYDNVNLRLIFGKYKVITSIDELLKEENMKNKYQSVLNDVAYRLHHNENLKEENYQGDASLVKLQELVDKQVNHEQEVQVLNATIQNKNAVISSLSKRIEKLKKEEMARKFSEK